MNKISLFIALIVAMFWLCPLSAADAEPPLARGVSLHGPLTWGRTNPERTEYLWPLYEGKPLPTGLLRQVKAAGFDFIRLSVDPGPFLAGKNREALERQWLDAVRQIQSTGLDVLVDFHPISMVSLYAPKRLVSDETLFSAYVEMIRRSARLLSALGTEHIAIEPMNEPPIGYRRAEAARWQRMMERLYDAVRAESPGMTIIVTGGRGGGIDGLLALDPAHFDARTRYSFHYYLPYSFTHQGTQKFRKTGVGYDRANRAAAGDGFDRVTAWAETHHIASQQIFLGEFGATQKSPEHDGALPEDRARWLADVRQEAEARGFHWALWNLNDPSSSGMTLVSVTHPDRLDARTLEALVIKR